MVLNGNIKQMLKILTIFVLILGNVFASLGHVPSVQAADRHVVISQVYGGGGNTGAQYTHDFVELYNPTANAISLDGWKVLYDSSSKLNFDAALKVELSGTIPAYGYYLIQLAGSTEPSSLPTPDKIGTISMSATNGVVGISDGEDIIDIVGFGSAKLYEKAPTPVLSNSTAAIRKVDSDISDNNRGLDTDDNSKDFIVGNPDPRNSKYDPNALPTVEKVKANLAEGDWPVNTPITLSTATEGATVFYKVNDGEFMSYVEPIIITGPTKITAYAEAESMEDSEPVTLTYGVASVKKIADIRGYAQGKPALVEGVITHKEGREIYIQDETAGIVLYDFNAELANVGDKVRVGGVMEIYRNLQELKPHVLFDYALVEKNVGVLSPKMITPEDLSTANGELVEAQYVRINDVEITAKNGSNVTAKSNNQTFTIYSGLSELTVGKKFEFVEGVIKQFDSVYQVIPLSSASLVENSFSVTASPAQGKIIEGGTVTLSTFTNGTIYYTTDGSVPSVELSDVYTAPIVINVDTTIKAIVVDGTNVSEVFTFVYEATKQPRIHDIQGGTHTSPYAGQTVSNIEGIVTQLGYYFGTGEYKGFFIQDLQPDDDESTSEGIYVFTTDKSKQPTVGDIVKISGSVSEYNEGSASNLTSTQITLSSIEVITNNVSLLPDPIVLGKNGRQIPSEIIDNDQFTVFDPEEDAIDFFESLEGMLVELPDPVITSPYWTGGNGNNKTYTIATRIDNGDDALISPLGGIVLKNDENQNPQRLLIAYVEPKQEVNTGDTFASNVVGVVGYNNGNFKIIPPVNELPEIIPANHEREVTSIVPTEDKLTVASYNILNYYPGVGAQKIEKLAESFAVNMKSPDIITVVEMQDKNGETNDGTVDADASQLIDAIKAKGGVEYTYVEIAPVNNQDGGAPGANIRVGFLYNADRVQLAESKTGLAGTATEAVTYNAETDQLSHNPGRIDPTNAVFNGSRKPIAAQFVFNGEKVIVIGAHFNSKSGDQGPYGINQPPVKSSETQREQIGTLVNNFVKNIVTENEDAKVIVMGDLNDFQFTKAVTALKGNELDNLVDKLPANDQYTYTYDGNSQVLDHILVTKNLTDKAVVDAVRLNADFSDAAGRVSDHDPIMAQIDFSKKSETPTPTPTPNPEPAPAPNPEPAPEPELTPTPETYVNDLAPVVLFNNLQQIVQNNGPFPEVPFVDSEHWAKDTIRLFTNLNLVNGYGDGTFKPDAQVTRAEFITILTRVFNLSMPSSTGSFKDVSVKDWYYETVQAAYAAGLIKGTDTGAFNPNEPISRQDLVVILSRAFNFAQFNNANPSLLDASNTSSYAKGAVEQAIQAGVLKGKGNGKVDPLASATRAEALEFIYSSLTLDPAIKSLIEELFVK